MILEDIWLVVWNTVYEVHRSLILSMRIVRKCGSLEHGFYDFPVGECHHMSSLTKSMIFQRWPGARVSHEEAPFWGQELLNQTTMINSALTIKIRTQTNELCHVLPHTKLAFCGFEFYLHPYLLVRIPSYSQPAQEDSRFGSAEVTFSELIVRDTSWILSAWGCIPRHGLYYIIFMELYLLLIWITWRYMDYTPL